MTLPGTKDYDELHELAEWNPIAVELTRKLWAAFEPHPVTDGLEEEE